MIRIWIKVVQIVLLTTVLVGANENLKNPFLWEVKKGTEKFYLFGTIHLADTKLNSLPLILKKTIDKSDEVRTEIAMDGDFERKSAIHMMRTDGKSLKSLLTPALYSGVQKYLKEINPNLSMYPFESMKVWGLSMIITMLENQMNNPTAQALDTSIYKYAKNVGKGVGGVESIEEQIAVMDGFSLEEQITDLEDTLNFLQKNKDYIENMKNVYIEGNGDKMMSLIEETMFHDGISSEVDKKFMQVMLYDRNAKMTKTIVQSLKSHPKSVYLFAFGVMHFLGTQSIVHKLEAHGYQIRRMK